MEYSFQNRRKNRVNLQLNSIVEPQVTIPKSQIKDVILQQYDKFLDLKLKNSKILYLSQTQEKLSSEIITLVSQLQGITDSSQSAEIQVKLEHLNSLYNELKEEYTQLLSTELNVLKSNFPGIFEKIIEGIDRQTLEHVLSVYMEHQKGGLTADQGLNKGMDYLTHKYSLPSDFFDRSATSKYYKQFDL